MLSALWSTRPLAERSPDKAVDIVFTIFLVYHNLGIGGEFVMRIFKSVLFLALFLISITLLALFSPSHAAGGFGFSSILKYVKPADKQGFHVDPYANNAQWAMEEWDSSRWTSAEAKGLAVVQRFYDSGLVTDQYRAQQGLILEVSDLFLRLSDGDKRKVAMVVADAYGVTDSAGPGGFFIEHKRTGSMIGAYTQHGLQLR